MSWYAWSGEDLILSVRVQPRASKDQIAGMHGDALKIRITAPPVDGAANAHVIEFLAGLFKVPKSQVTLVSGETSRNKRLRISRPKVLIEGITRPTSG